jgi:hypothetical protein
MIGNAKKSSKSRTGKGKLQKGEFSIKVKDIEEVYKAQNGLCYYSGIPMNYDKSELRLSLERKNPDIGYTSSNIALCCLEFNGASQWSHEKIEEMLIILEKNTTPENIDFARKKKNVPRQKLKQLVRNATSSTKSRRNKRVTNNMTRDFTIDITFDYLVDLFNQQKGLCAYSNMPLCFGNTDINNWVVSLERRDPYKGYTKENTCLICFEFNGIDNSTKLNCMTSGNGAWNVPKFKYIMAFIKRKFNKINEAEFNDMVNASGFVQALPYVPTNEKVKHINANTIHGLDKPNAKYDQELVDNMERMGKTHDWIFIIKNPDGLEFIGRYSPVYSYKDLDILINAFNGKSNCIQRYKLLNDSIDEEGIDNFEITSYGFFEISISQQIEKDLVISRNTLHPNGLNNVVKQRQSTSIETRKQISDTLSNITRLGHLQQELPKYIRLVNDKNNKGYGIIGHPKCKRKVFATTRLYNDDVMNKKLELCIDFIKQLDSQG